MEEYFDSLSQCPLFAGISQQELGRMLSCLGGKITGIAKGNAGFFVPKSQPTLYYPLSYTNARARHRNNQPCSQHTITA